MDVIPWNSELYLISQKHTKAKMTVKTFYERS